jgi:hypothetical protein
MGAVARLALRTVVAGALGVAGGGCSLLIDLSDTTGGRGSDAAPDVVADAGEGTDGLASSDAGNGNGDAGVDADEGGSAHPPGTWCATDAPSLWFCDDFDDGALGARWTGATLQVAGSATLSTTNRSSAPNGFDIGCPALTPSTFLTEALTESIPAASKVTLAFDLDPIAFPADGHGGTLYLATLTQGPGTPRNAIQFRAGTTLVDLQEQVILASGAIKSGTGMWGSATLIPTGGWSRVEMAVDFAATPATATLRLGGQTVATASLDPSWTRAATTFYLGDWYIPGTPAFHVAYDNVTIDVAP